MRASSGKGSKTASAIRPSPAATASPVVLSAPAPSAVPASLEGFSAVEIKRRLGRIHKALASEQSSAGVAAHRAAILKLLLQVRHVEAEVDSVLDGVNTLAWTVSDAVDGPGLERATDAGGGPELLVPLAFHVDAKTTLLGIVCA